MLPQASTSSRGKQAKPRLKPIALPVEHGGWGFTLEPVLLGLLVAPTWAGGALGGFALSAFLTRHPLKLWLADSLARRQYPRTKYARRFALLYGGAALAALGLAMRFAREDFWMPLVLAVPLVLVQLSLELRDQARSLVAEIAGALAMGALAPAIALAAGVDAETAYGLWLVLGGRGIAAIFYARVQVRRARGKGEQVRLAPAWLAMTLSTLVLFAAAWSNLIPWLGAISTALLLPLAGITFYRPAAPAKVVGWTQIAFGLLVVMATVTGVRAGW